jgi:SAM-dependent methyltransferase
MSDILTRSNAHWSEAGRQGMDAFYRLATDDYRHLAEARDWRGLFEKAQIQAGERALRLLDVACGSGKFPNALARHGGLVEANIRPVEVDLLDPSAFSIAEARVALTKPFVPAAEYETTLQDFEPPAEGYDIVWATHALYAIPQAELATAMARFMQSIAPGGLGVVAHSAATGHYVDFHRRWLAAFDPEAAPYIGAQAIVAALRDAGFSPEVQVVRYESVAGAGEIEAVEGYLQRCVFDDRISLDQMAATEPMASYLSTCKGADGWRFAQDVWLITVNA